MTCDDIRKLLKQFLDDRLVEKEYHAFFLHLENCAECKEYVKAVGSLSNQVWKLSDMDVPSDLSSNIIFKLRQSEQDAPQNSLVLSKEMVRGGIILIVVFFIFLGGIKLLEIFESSSKISNVGTVQTHTIEEQKPIHEDMESSVTQIIEEQEPISDEEAKYLYGQLQAMAESLEPISNIESDEQVPEKIISKEGDSLVSDEPLESDGVLIPDSFSLHWHIPYTGDHEKEQLLETIKILGIDLEYEDQDFLVFNTTNKKVKLLSEGIQFTNKVDLNLPAFILGGSLPDNEVSVSISFKSRTFLEPETSILPGKGEDVLISHEKTVSLDPYVFDWHFLLISSQQDVLMNVIRRNGGLILYQSKKVVIFSILTIGIKELVQDVQSLGGIFADFGGTDFDENPTTRRTVNVLIYISEK